MARTRSIKPEFWSDEKIGGLTFLERLLFIGLWTFADDEGLCRANQMFLKSMIFPYDTIDPEVITTAMDNLSKNGLIFRYQKENQKYLWVVKFRVYQRIDKPQKPTNPNPSIQNGDYREAINRRDNLRCHICNSICSQYQILGKALDPRVVSVDHIIPVSKGGGDYPSNLKTACISCNKSRGSKDIESFLNNHGMIKDNSKNIHGTINDETETETETEKKQKQKQKQKLSDPETIQEIIFYLNEKTGSNFNAKQYLTQNLIFERMAEGFTVKDFRAVIDLKTEQWIEDKKMSGNLRPATLFAVDKFEGYVQEVKRNGGGEKLRTAASILKFDGEDICRQYCQEQGIDFQEVAK